MITTLYEHTPPASDVPGLQHMEQTVRLTEDSHGRRVWVGWASYTLEQAEDVVATLQAAIEVGKRATEGAQAG